MILRFKKYVSLTFFMHIIHEKKKFNDNIWFIKTYKNDRSTKEKTTLMSKLNRSILNKLRAVPPQPGTKNENIQCL